MKRPSNISSVPVSFLGEGIVLEPRRQHSGPAPLLHLVLGKLICNASQGEARKRNHQ